MTYLSLTLLLRPFCGCDNVKELSRIMTEDLAATVSSGDRSVSFSLSDTNLNNPWGTKRGAIYAWRLANQMSDRRIGRAVVL